VANTSRFVRLAAVALFLSLLDGRSAQAPPEPVTRFRAVERYSLYVKLKSDDDMKVEVTGESLQRKFKEQLVARIDLTERHLDNDYVEWTGEGFAEQILELEHKEVHFGGNFVKEWKSQAQGRSKTKAKLVIDELKKTFQVIVDTESIEGTSSGTRKDNPGAAEQITGQTSLVTTAVRWLQTYPLPAAGLVLQVNDKPYPMEQCGTYLGDFDWLRIHGDHVHKGLINLNLAPPEVNPPKLILTPPPDYLTWRPKPPLTLVAQPQPKNVASVDSQIQSSNFLLQIRYPNLLPMAFRFLAALQVRFDPGLVRPTLSPFDVGWEVVQTGSKSKVTRVVFQLAEVSRYKGWCMNWPVTPEADPQPDLEFVPPTTHADWTLNKTIPELTIHGVTAQAGIGTVRLGSLDGAATGVLIAEAELEGGRSIRGVIKGNDRSTRLLIPDRDEGEDIARGWKAKFARNMGDDADEDDDPKGDGQKGDGLTVWEEYRGFVQGQTWRDNCDPRKKDLFIENTIGDGAQAGIDLFGKVTGIVIHDKLVPNDERRSDRVINFNARSDRHVTDQHCLVIRLRPKPDKDGMSSSNIEGNFLDELILGVDMGPPKNVEWVNISPKMLDQSTVAHELSHAVGVHHHGEGDVTPVEWTVQDINGRRQVFEAGKPINVVNEPSTRVLLEEIFIGYPLERKRKVYLGAPQGLHSGYEKCWMRYDLANAYVFRNQPEDTRIWPRPETETTELCRSEHGVSFNKEGPTGNKPHSRYGSAAKGRGNCMSQIVISDRWESRSP